jgi:hypothetical protein
MNYIALYGNKYVTFSIYSKKFLFNLWGRRGMHIGYWWESQKERDHWEDQDVGGWTILKWILER